MKIAAITLTAMVMSVPTAASSSAPDFSTDAFLIGHWMCDVEREGRGPAREDAVYSWALGGRWLALTYTLTLTEEDAPSATTMAYETFDAKLGKWLYFSFHSDGSYGTFYSDGWRSNEKVYGPGPACPQQWKLVTTRVSDREFTEEVHVPSGNAWRRTFFLHCRKSAERG